MGAGLLFALTLPGVVLLLVVVAVVEQAASRRGRRSIVTRGRRHALSAGGLDVLSSALVPGREVDLEEQRSRQIVADDVQQGGPPRDRIDRGRGSPTSEDHDSEGLDRRAVTFDPGECTVPPWSAQVRRATVKCDQFRDQFRA